MIGKINELSLSISYDWSIFEFLTDTQFAKTNDISKQRAGQLRKKYAPHTNTRLIFRKQKLEYQKKIDILILEYIKTNFMCVNIKEFLKNNCLNWDKSLNKERFKKIANENEITIFFKHGNFEYPHGLNCVRKNDPCHCEIGKLANAISQRHYNNYNKSLSTDFVNYLSNEYIEFYKGDESPRHKDFYKDIDEEVEFYFDDLEVEIVSAQRAS